MSKAILLLSGGLDSCATAAWAKDRFDEVIPITFAYGQRHSREVLAAESISDRLFGKLPRTMNLTQPFTLVGGSSLTSGITDGNPSTESVERTEDQLPPTFVPGRNIIFLAIAAGLMYTEQASAIIGGWNAVDYSGYPDCRPGFLRDMTRALANGLGFTQFNLITVPTEARGADAGMNLYSPLVYLKKSEIIRLGLVHHAPFDVSWSCYAGGTEPCGTCDSCTIRINGFKEVGIEDPALVKV